MTDSAAAPVPLDRHKLAAARLWAATRFPYMATALFASTVVPAEGLDGVAVDESWRLYVDPALLDGWTVEDVGSLLVHHTGHLIRDHAGRARSLGITETAEARWCLAADAELNDDLAEAGLTQPGDVVTPEGLGFQPGRLAEEYFHLLPAEPDSGDGDDGDVGEDGEDGDGGEDGEHGAGDGDGGDGHPDHGSGQHAQAREWEQPTGDGNAPGLSSHEGHLMRCQVANEILNESRRGVGNIPANWKRWAEDLLDPRVNWRKVLAAEVRRGVQSVAGCVDYTYRRPSRRQSVSADVILPSLQKPIPEVAIVCDTSGSMGSTELNRVLSEVEGLLRGIGLRGQGVRVLAVDAAVHSIKRVNSARQVELVGGGGTDMGRGIAAAAALRPRPSVVVVLTDGMTPWPAEAPRGIKVIVGLISTEVRFPTRDARASGRRGSSYGAPHWARVVHIEEAA